MLLDLIVNYSIQCEMNVIVLRNISGVYDNLTDIITDNCLKVIL